MSKARELAELGAVYDSGALSNRNFIINGAMQVFQRGTSFSGNSAYNADRWKVDNNSGGGGQSTDAPDGFTYSLKINPSSGDAAPRQAIELPAAGEGGVFRSGQKFTLSFYLKSDNAGESINIFIASGTNVDATTTSQVNDTSTGLTTATSWTRYTYTFTSNNVGGSDTCYNIVPYVGSPSGAIYLTGVQLELGTEATPFEHRSFGQELALCQRYFYRTARGTTGSVDDAYIGIGRGGNASNTSETFFSHPVFMRASPTVTFDGNIVANDGSAMASSGVSTLEVGVRGGFVYGTGHASGITINEALRTYFQSDGEGMNVDAEL